MSSKLHRLWFLVGSCVVILLVVRFSSIWRSVGAESLPDLGSAPDFTLSDQLERTISMADLKGRVLLVNFVYTSCPDTCPIQTARMAQLQPQLQDAGLGPDRIRLISITVDPERDTPVRLRGYAEQFGADPDLWNFLTGPVAEVRRVIVEGFKVAASETEHDHEHGDEYIVAHSDRTLLVDPAGTIRAYYRSEEWDPAQIITDIKGLSS